MQMLRNITLSLIVFLSFASIAHAADYKYAPQGCDFEVMLPSTPTTMRRCHPALPDKCDLKTAFTHVYNMQATLNVYISCDPVSQEDFDTISEDAIRTSLIALSGGQLETYQTNTERQDDMYMGMILGAGSTASNVGTLYTSQIWITPNSKLIVEGEIIGGEHKEADETLINVLHSVTRISGKSSETSNDDDSETSNDSVTPTE